VRVRPARPVQVDVAAYCDWIGVIFFFGTSGVDGADDLRGIEVAAIHRPHIVVIFARGNFSRPQIYSGIWSTVL
jgi:hypothetical protein